MSQLHLTQVKPHDRWPSGDSKPVAFLAVDPDRFVERYGLVFEQDADELGAYRLAAISVPPDQAWFVIRADSPRRGVEVYADKQADDRFTLLKVLHALKLQRRHVVWASDPRWNKRPTLPVKARVRRARA